MGARRPAALLKPRREGLRQQAERWGVIHAAELARRRRGVTGGRDG
jgi:hypothetical protein